MLKKNKKKRDKEKENWDKINYTKKKSKMWQNMKARKQESKKARK